MSTKRTPLLRIALTANLFEWYEFSLSGFMALEIGRRFFPAVGDKTALLLSFFVFAGSYLVRPLGCLFWGYLSDRRGTAYALNASLIVMAIPATLIACLPTYASIGYWATALLVALKLVQGFGAGGEAPLSGYYVALHTHGRKRGPYAALAASSAYLGMLLASFVVWILPYCAALISKWMDGAPGAIAHSWRWPFLLCLPLSCWIASLRRTLIDSEASPSLIPRVGRPLIPLAHAAIIVAFMGVTIYTSLFWLPSYLEIYCAVPRDMARLGNLVALIALVASISVAGYLTR